LARGDTAPRRSEGAAPADDPGRESPRRRRRARKRGAWRSPLTRRILAINVLVLAIPVLGLLHLEQYRDSLVEAELEALRTQARAFATTLAGSAVVVTQSGEEKLLAEGTRHAMRVLLSGSDLRARLFGPGGQLVADSFVLMGPGGQVTVEELPPPERDDWMPDVVRRAYDTVLDYVPGDRALPLYAEARRQKAEHYLEAERALAGDADSRVYRDSQGGLVLSVAMPVQRYRQVLGALMLTKDGSEVEAAVRDRRLDVLVVFAVALAVTVLLSIYLAGAIARPLHRLAEAADRVRRAQGRQAGIPDLSKRRDEIGDLSVSLDEMTQALWDRLDAIERFAADVAHEIKNPLTSVRSAVETVARVDDAEQQKKLMGIILDDVQRLDRLISDISDASRLDAELSRAQSEPVGLSRLLDALVEVESATAKERGGPAYAIDLPKQADGTTDPLTIQGLEGRLGQVFRNLLQNAATFSPAAGTVRVTARRRDGWVAVTVADEGPGVPENKLKAIFDRFYTERPKDEKFGIHSGLGLSISKQIVEAHGGTLEAENRRDADGHVQGALFTVRLPAE
jgi:two-component system sensor histidine kinase ChvG